MTTELYIHPHVVEEKEKMDSQFDDRCGSILSFKVLIRLFFLLEKWTVQDRCICMLCVQSQRPEIFRAEPRAAHDTGMPRSIHSTSLPTLIGQVH
jgi:hypothetical protein